MIDITQLAKLITALRTETQKAAISPETVGSILQRIAEMLAEALVSKDIDQLLRLYRNLTGRQLLTGIEQGALDKQQVYLNISSVDPVTGLPATAVLATIVAPADNTQAGFMTAAHVAAIEQMTAKAEAAEPLLRGLAAVPQVLVSLAQGKTAKDQVYFDIAAVDTAQGRASYLTNKVLVQPATTARAGWMTAAHVTSLNKLGTQMSALEPVHRALNAAEQLITSIAQGTLAKDQVYLNIGTVSPESGLAAVLSNVALIKTASQERAGWMTAAHVTALQQHGESVTTLSAKVTTLEKKVQSLGSQSGGGGGASTGTGLAQIALRVEDGELHIYGHDELIRQGYEPFLWRRVSRKYKYHFGERWNRKEVKGWNMMGHAGVVNIDKGVLSFPIAEKKYWHQMQAGEQQELGYSRTAENLMKPHKTSAGVTAVGWGRRTVEVEVGSEDDGYTYLRMLRFEFGIAFAKPRRFNTQTLLMTELASNMAVFSVLHNVLRGGASKWSFGA